MKTQVNTKLIFLPFLLISCFFNFLPAQDTTFYDRKWKEVARVQEAAYYRLFQKEGNRWMERTYNKRKGNLYSEGAYKSQKKEISTGLWTYYFIDGTKQKEINFVENEYQGAYAEWYYNGNPMEVGNYQAGNKIGLWEKWHQNGKPMEVGEYKKGDKIGSWEKWYNNGQKKSEETYTGGAFSEVLNYWDRDGNHLVIEGNGKLIESFPLGKVKFEGQIKNKLREGEFRVYYGMGPLLEKVNFSGNKANGAHQYFYEDGSLELEGQNKDNFPVGLWKFYSRDGSTVMRKNYIQELRTASIEPYTFASRKPIPINIEEVKRKIGYPKVARRRGIEGTVLCRVLVGMRGNYIKHEIIKSSDPILEKAVVAHIGELSFTRAFQNHYIFRYWVGVPFNFRLTK